MRKRISRPRQFAAIDNKAIDGLPSILGIGLLTRLIRAKDGDDVTVETLASSYEEGEKSLTKAMRSLVDGAYVVKFKIQRATTETVTEDGKEVEKRGGSWFTTFTVDSIPFTREDIAAMVAEIYAEGNVKSHRVEPTRLDPRNAPGEPARRPAPPRGGVGATRGNVGGQSVGTPGSGSRPTPPSGAPGRPTPGQGGAHIRNKTFSPDTEMPEDESDALSGRSPGERRRQTTGSSPREEGGGSAASGKTSPPLPQAQRQAVQAVRDLLPAELNQALGDKTPGNIQADIITALAAGTPRERTVEQLVRYRLMPRWERYWAARFYAGELTPKMPSGRLKQPFGPLSQMLEDTAECSNLTCEDRRDFVLEGDCRACEMRKVDRRADRTKERQDAATDASSTTEAPAVPMPSPRASQAVWWDCKMCPASAKGEPPADGICRRCREKAAVAVAWTDPDASSYEEPAAGPSDADLAAEKRAQEEAALDARLRAEQAAMYGTPEQQAMYATSAPF
ncbi:hypothetical protein [Streptomyces sp. NPDC060366]|uniref:hypothetical protein n=1 Tax=Streptomyces sp. NPDC060366 TaxID=3347105 RepID=UPI0036616720